MFTIPFGKPSAEEKLACLNWPASFPYAPEVSFSIWHDKVSIHLKYTVSEKTTKAEQTEPGGPVYFDSCVEFFIRPQEDDARYYNFEWNAAGHLAMSCRLSREQATSAPLQVLESVKAKASLGSEPFPEKSLSESWTLEVEIPLTAFFAHKVDSLSGKKMYINAYKCGDGLKTPHYLSWAPIDTPSPDFHRPEFFVPVMFE